MSMDLIFDGVQATPNANNAVGSFCNDYASILDGTLPPGCAVSTSLSQVTVGGNYLKSYKFKIKKKWNVNFTCIRNICLK